MASATFIMVLISIFNSNASWLVYYIFLFEEIILTCSISWCYVLHVATIYTTIATYSWMLCEGAYLQLLLMDAFHDDRKRVRKVNHAEIH